ncbi:MAG: hypothetical protein R3311_10085 [Oceanisphaera sp.]|nr:hypothetical protein [Oceanisphaera sp.]
MNSRLHLGKLALCHCGQNKATGQAQQAPPNDSGIGCRSKPVAGKSAREQAEKRQAENYEGRQQFSGQVHVDHNRITDAASPAARNSYIYALVTLCLPAAAGAAPGTGLTVNLNTYGICCAGMFNYNAFIGHGGLSIYPDLSGQGRRLNILQQPPF